MSTTQRNYKAEEGGAQPLGSIVPTLLIGLGGTGKDILQRYRKTVWEKFGDPTTPFAQTLVFDTDMQGGSDIPSGEEAAAYSNVRLRADQGEWYTVEIKPDLYEQAKADLTKKSDRRYEKWLHPEFFSYVSEAAVRDGSGGFRQAGRLAFFIHYKKIREAIENKLGNMTAYMADSDRKAKNQFDVKTDRVEIVIISSLAGGTGGGMFMDVAYLVRDILSTVPKFERRGAFDPAGLDSHVTFIALLPTPYTRRDAAMKDRFQLNGYSAMLEIEDYNTPRPEDNFFEEDEGGSTALKFSDTQFRVNWDDAAGVEKTIDGRPWETCYLVDDTNDKHRQAPRDLPEIYQMVADYLFMDLGNDQFAIQKWTTRSNHAPLSSKMVIAEIGDPTLERGSSGNGDIIYEERHSCIYSSFGLAEIFVDPQRMRKAASLRLASKLIRSKIISKDNIYTDDDYSRWAKEDLFAKAASDADQPSYDPNKLTATVLADESIDWITWADQHFDKLAELDPIVAARDIVERLGRFLATTKRLVEGERVDGIDGTIKHTLEYQTRRLRGSNDTGPLRKRLDSSSSRRANEIGFAPVLQLLKSYADELSKARHEVHEWREQEIPDLEQMLARLIDAIRVPLFSKKSAIRIEYPRAIENVRRRFFEFLRSVAARYLDGIYDDAIRFVSIGGSLPVGSLADRYHAWIDMLDGMLHGSEGLCRRLDSQFEVFRRQPNSDRQIALMPEWRAEEYDAETNSHLMRHPEIGPDSRKPGGPDTARVMLLLWKALDQNNSTELLESIDRADESRDGRQRIVEDFTAAARSLLGENYGMSDFANGDVSEFLMTQPIEQRSPLLERMIDSSAPYLPSRDVPSAQPYWSNLLGINGSSRRDPMLDEINGLSIANSDNIDRDSVRRTINCHASRIVLLHELAAAPLHFWARLPDLRQSYFNPEISEFRRTCHIRFREQAAELPEIEPLGDDQYARISSNATNILRAFLLQQISCSDEHGFSIDVKDKFQTRSYMLGRRLDRMIRNACLTNEVCKGIDRAWMDWKELATPLHHAVLYSAIQQNLRQLPARISTDDSGNRPIFNCLRKLLHDAERDLLAVPEGPGFFDVLRHRDVTDADYDDWQPRFTALCQHVRETCLVTACESTPLLQVDQSQIENVIWPA